MTESLRRPRADPLGRRAAAAERHLRDLRARQGDGVLRRALDQRTLIDRACADRIAAVGYDYVGISLDGIGEVHDRFRRQPGAYDAALGGMRLSHERRIKVGPRFTMTERNVESLPAMLDLVDAEGIDKFYLSHIWSTPGAATATARTTPTTGPRAPPWI